MYIHINSSLALSLSLSLSLSRFEGTELLGSLTLSVVKLAAVPPHFLIASNLHNIYNKIIMGTPGMEPQEYSRNRVGIYLRGSLLSHYIPTTLFGFPVRVLIAVLLYNHCKLVFEALRVLQSHKGSKTF